MRRLISIAAAVIVSGAVAAPSAQAEPGVIDVDLVSWVRIDTDHHVDVAGAFNCFHGDNIGYWTVDLSLTQSLGDLPVVRMVSGTCEDSGLMTFSARFPYSGSDGCIWPEAGVASIQADVKNRWWADGMSWQTETGSLTIDAPEASFACRWW